ncbi:MAG: hypothetical protein J7J22_01120 [Candidatus Verstraetearchaeota archaeon]|nr:hypothetical protein [Candidatus Verstraetearchaeota archaeon]
MKKRTLIIIFATLLLFAVGGFGAYFLFTSPEQKEGAENIQITEPISQPKEVSTQPEEITSPPKEPTTTESIDTSDWEIYRNEKYGYEIRYPFTFEEVSENKTWFGPPPNVEGGVTILVSPKLTIYSPNAAGYLSEEEVKEIVERIKGTPFYEEKIINNIPFMVLYLIAYQGMGAWEENIHCIARNKANREFYIITLAHPFMAAPETPREEVKKTHLQALRNGSMKFAEFFWKMIGSFGFIGD